jgi:GT2 family glycosyltransferase/glycosyltransferase involved in cell wall biosynthesis
MSDPVRRTEARPAPGDGPILFVTFSGVAGGSERVLLDVLGALEQPVVLLCPRGGLAGRARAAGIPVLVRPQRPLELRGGPRTAAAAVVALGAHAADVRRTVRALQAGAVVAWGMRSAIASAVAVRAVGAGRPLIFEHADLLPGGPVAAVVRAAARAADRVIAMSHAIARDLDPDGRLGERLRVAEPGVDVERFAPAPPPAGPPTALFLGAIVRWKRPDLALEAVAHAAGEVPGLRLVLAGHAVGEASEELLAGLRRRAARPDLAGRVEFAGALADPRPALAAATCLLHCAEREPFGLVVVEAMASARPVVAPADGGPVEILDDDAGRLYPPGDAAAAGRALAAVAGDPAWARRAGEHGRRRAAERFSLPAAAGRWREAAGPALDAAPPDPRAGADVTLVTVTHNSSADLAVLLASARRWLPAARVVVADAGSTDDSLAAARAWPGGATVIELDNVGYGRAANAGVAVAETAACIVLNPDVELVDPSPAALAAEALRGPERLLAPVVLRPDGARQDSVHPEPVSAAAALSALVPPAALPGPLRRRVQPWRADAPRPVAWAVGCCIAARTETLRRLGPFDERIFLYGEDLELGLRAHDAGIRTWWWPHARVIHHQAHASRKAFGGEPFDRLAAQRRAVIGERRGARAARLDDVLQLVTFADRVALKALAGRPTQRERRQIAALRRARRGALQ